jgi:hypothetical protein
MMPKINGSQPQSDNNEPHYQLMVQLLAEYRDKFIELSKKDLADHMTFSRLNIVAMTQFGAMLAVDVGMSDDQFLNVCRSNFEEAFKRAPRFS